MADLAFADLAALPPHPDLPPAILRQLQHLALGKLAAPSQSGNQVLQNSPYSHQKSPGSTEKWSTTLRELDELLDGGFESAEVVEVAGGRQSGRSALVFYTLLYHLLTHVNHRAVFLHTSAQFDAPRCRSILHVLVEDGRANGVTFESEEEETLTTDELAIKVLGRLSVIHPLSPAQALEGISAELEKDEEGLARLSMVVIDSAETLLGGEALSAASAEGEWRFPGALGSLTLLADRSCHSRLLLPSDERARSIACVNCLRGCILVVSLPC